jgi:hypothetical protein
VLPHLRMMTSALSKCLWSGSGAGLLRFISAGHCLDALSLCLGYIMSLLSVAACLLLWLSFQV